MKLLAFSDVHNNLVAVRKLRALEENSFDAVVVAGDIGSESAAKFFKILSTFKCPIMYVFGNWDHELDYKASFGRDCSQIHLNVLATGNLNFTGFSGCPTNWGKNPIARRLRRSVDRVHKNIADTYSHAEGIFWTELERIGPEEARKSLQKIERTRAYRKYAAELQVATKQMLEINRQSLGQAFKRAEIDPRQTIVVTHERLGHLSREIPGAFLHLFGRIHRFSEHTFKGTKYVNVSALDRPITARPQHKSKWCPSDCRNFNAGNYAIVEINTSLDVKVRCVHLPQDYRNWIPLEGRQFHGIDWVPQEKEWTDPTDPPLRKYEVIRVSRHI